MQVVIKIINATNLSPLPVYITYNYEKYFYQLKNNISLLYIKSGNLTFFTVSLHYISSYSLQNPFLNRETGISIINMGQLYDSLIQTL